jgi:hypothetical protein
MHNKNDLPTRLIHQHYWSFIQAIIDVRTLKPLRMKQGITNTRALPIDKMLYIYQLCPHSEHQKKIHSNLNSLNTFTQKIGLSNVKLILIR